VGALDRAEQYLKQIAAMEPVAVVQYAFLIRGAAGVGDYTRYDFSNLFCFSDQDNSALKYLKELRSLNLTPNESIYAQVLAALAYPVGPLPTDAKRGPVRCCFRRDSDRSFESDMCGGAGDDDGARSYSCLCAHDRGRDEGIPPCSMC
jgi:hypothetical protein